MLYYLQHRARKTKGVAPAVYYTAAVTMVHANGNVSASLQAILQLKIDSLYNISLIGVVLVTAQIM